jgi:chromosome segregation ATPase
MARPGSREVIMTEHHMEVLAHKLETLHSDVREIETVLRELAAAITRLALIEERQSQAAAALERAFITMDKLEARISSLEQLAPSNRRLHIWIDRGIWGLLGLMGMALVKQIGLGS